MHGAGEVLGYNSAASRRGTLAELQVVRYPTVPSLEQYKDVDVQVGGRLFQQVPPKRRTDLWANLTKRTFTGRESVMKYPGLQAQVGKNESFLQCGVASLHCAQSSFVDLALADTAAGALSCCCSKNERTPNTLMGESRR